MAGVYFREQQEKIQEWQTKLDVATQALESYIEEHATEGGLLADALNENDKVTKLGAVARLKKTNDPEEQVALKKVIHLLAEESEIKSALKDWHGQLDHAVFQKYSQLTEVEIKLLLVQFKWLPAIHRGIEAEIERITQQLANRVRELEERYAEPLPTIEKEVEKLSAQVAEHLKAMGLEWQV